MNLIIVDDNTQFRESLQVYIKLELGFVILACYENAHQLINSDKLYHADIILLDIEMPEINGIEAAKKVLWDRRQLKIIATTNYQEEAYLLDLISAGFKGCVYKNEIFRELANAIDDVQRGNFHFPDIMKSYKINNNPYSN